MHLDRILRYPVKSLSVEGLSATKLTPGQGLPYDRHWALARPDGEAAGNRDWHPKSNFLVLVREYALALLESRFDEATTIMRLSGPNGINAEGDLSTSEGREAIAQSVATHLGLDETGIPQLVEAQEIGYFDTTKGPVSLLNMSSHRALEDAIGHSLDPVRFRMNFLLEGMEPWVETLWPGKRLKIGDAVLEVTENTGRCKATHVNPDSGDLDVKILHALKEHYGHTQMGIYAVVVEGGAVNSGDHVTLLD